MGSKPKAKAEWREVAAAAANALLWTLRYSHQRRSIALLKPLVEKSCNSFRNGSFEYVLCPIQNFNLEDFQKYCFVGHYIRV
jgi:hypothetical protein